jgi:hypothetical protein
MGCETQIYRAYIIKRIGGRTRIPEGLYVGGAKEKS